MKNRKYLTQNEIKLLLACAQNTRHGSRDYCLIFMGFIHGLRASELRYWRFSDIGCDAGYLHVKRLKNRHATIHPLVRGEKELISTLLRENFGKDKSGQGWLFLSQQGYALSRQRIYNIIKGLGVRVGLTVNAHPHMLRHACGFALADMGIDTRLIQDYLGHRNIRHTVLYTASNANRFLGIWRDNDFPQNGSIRTKMTTLSIKKIRLSNFF